MKVLSKTYFVLVVAILLTGCGQAMNMKALAPATYPDTFHEYAEMLAPEKSFEVKFPDGKNFVDARGGKGNLSIYCPRDHTPNLERTLLNAAANYCHAKGGKLVGGGIWMKGESKWCSVDEDTPLFGYSYVYDNKHCSGLRYAYLTDASKSSEFAIDMNQRAGFVSPRQSKQIAEAKQAKYEADSRRQQIEASSKVAEINSRRAEAASYAVGSNVCTFIGEGFDGALASMGPRYIAKIIENHGETLDLLIHTELVGFGGARAGFKPYRSYEQGHKWRACS